MHFYIYLVEQAGEYCEELRPLAFKRVDVAPWQFMEQWEYRKQQAMEKQVCSSDRTPICPRRPPLQFRFI